MHTSGYQLNYFSQNDPHIKDLAYDGTYLWAINTDGVIKKFDTVGTLVDSISGLLTGGWGLTWDGEFLWASDPNKDTIYQISVYSTPTYSISGYVKDSTGAGITNVAMILSGDTLDTVYTSSTGYYQFTGLVTGNYTVTPYKDELTFEPTQISYTPLNANQTNQNYVGRICAQWSTNLAVSGCGFNYTLTFGAHCNGTDGFDMGLDTTCSPPPPIGFYSYFSIDTLPTYLSTDIRSSSDTCLTWTLKILNATGCTDTIRWNSANLPASGDFALDGIDMRANSLAIYQGNQTLHISYCVTRPNVGPISISSPQDTVYCDSTYSVTATVKNFGNTDATFNVKCYIDSYSDVKQVTNLAPGESTQVQFSSWLASCNDTICVETITVITQLNNDVNPYNDTLKKVTAILCPPSFYSISGYVRDSTGAGITNVAMILSNATSDTVYTNSIGYYEFTNVPAGNHTVTPSKASWTFEPNHRSYTPLNSDTTNQNYVGRTCTQWQIPLTITCCGTIYERTFGVHCNGTDGFDSALDSTTPPPGMTCYAYFYLDEVPYYLDKDIRSSNDSSITWTLKIDNATGCTDTIRWNPTNLPVEGSFRLNGIDMRTDSLAAYEGNQILHISYSMTYEIHIPLVAMCGWNMVSVPVIPQVKDVDSVFLGNCGVYTWTGIDYIAPDTVEPGLGYWVCFVNPCTLIVTGTPITHYTRHLTVGWNMIGSTAENVDFSNPNDDPDGSIVAGALYAFDPTSCAYTIANTIEPAKGYWVASINDCNLTVGNPTSAKQSMHSTLDYGINDATPTWLVNIEIKSTDSTLAPINLRLGVAPIAMNRSVPPAFPETKFDAWLKGMNYPFDRLAVDIRENDTTNTWNIFVKSDDRFTINWYLSNLPTAHALLLSFDGKEINMKQQSTYSIKSIDNNLMHFEIKVTETPQIFNLLQNTPNPFTDITSIGFQLPHKAHVKLAIYNIIGQEICKLIDKDVDVGFHSIQWDGRDSAGRKVPTGMYFYRIQVQAAFNTDIYKSIKKMMLLH